MNLILAMACLLSAADEDNPEYGAWSGFKKGAWVKMRSTSDAPNDKALESTLTLLEVAADKVVLESQFNGVRAKRTIPAKLPRRPPEKPATAEGDEEIEVAGRRLKCRWSETTIEVAGQKVTRRVWRSRDVPGGIAKAVTQGAHTGTMVAVDWKDGP